MGTRPVAKAEHDGHRLGRSLVPAVVGATTGAMAMGTIGALVTAFATNFIDYFQTYRNPAWMSGAAVGWFLGTPLGVAVAFRMRHLPGAALAALLTWALLTFVCPTVVMLVAGAVEVLPAEGRAEAAGALIAMALVPPAVSAASAIGLLAYSRRRKLRRATPRLSG